MTLTVAGLQHAGEPGDVQANLATITTAATLARHQGAELLVTPEMFVTGYNIEDDLGPLAAADLDVAIAEIARSVGIGIVAGLPEVAPDGGLYNTALLVDDSGAELARYRKTHLFGDLDRSLFVPGEVLPPPVLFRGVRVSLLICYDVEFPETVRRAALAGAELIIVPTAQMEPFSFVAEQLIRTRAWENQAYVAYVNRCGAEQELTYVGRSSIVSPYGEVLASLSATDTGLMTASIDTDVVARARVENPYLDDLRLQLYGES